MLYNIISKMASDYTIGIRINRWVLASRTRPEFPYHTLFVGLACRTHKARPTYSFTHTCPTYGLYYSKKNLPKFN